MTSGKIARLTGSTILCNGFAILSACALFDPFDFKPVRASAEDIYEFESQYYPRSSWSYQGSDSRWHYLDPVAIDSEGTLIGLFTEYKLPRRLLPDLKGVPYDEASPRSLSADVEIHAQFIRIEIEGEPAFEIPFESPGFITADHRPRRSNRSSIPEPTPSIHERKAALSGDHRVKDQLNPDGSLEIQPPD